MNILQSMWEKAWDNIIYAPILAFFFKPIKERVNNFLKSIWPWYINSIYKSASANNINRPAIFTLTLVSAFVFILSEFALLSMYNPKISLLDKTMVNYPEQVDRSVLVVIFCLNVSLFVLVMRLELVYSAITRFNQMLTIVRPSIETQKYYELRKRWALMRTVQDYNSLIMELLNSHKILIDYKEKFPEEIKLFNKLNNSSNELNATLSEVDE